MTGLLGKSWVVTFGNSKLPCKHETDAKLLVRQLLKKGYTSVTAQTLDGAQVVQTFQIAAWLDD
jgi:hypothetical protein